mgnify:CR=1 FL=1
MAKQRGTALEPEEKRRINKQNLSKLNQIFKFLTPYKGAFFAGLLFLLFSLAAQPKILAIDFRDDSKMFLALLPKLWVEEGLPKWVVI